MHPAFNTLSHSAAAARRMLAKFRSPVAARPKGASERERRRACSQVLRAFLRWHGYAAQSVASRADVREMIEKGIQPADLRRLLDERLERLPGLLLGYQTVGHRHIPVRLPASYRLRHVLIDGATGTGKTTLNRHMIRAAMEGGEGLCVIAPEAEFIHEEILPFVPKHRLDDVVVIDPTDVSRPVPFNPVHLQPGEDIDLKAGELAVTFQRLCDETSSAVPRMELIHTNSVYALLPIAGATLLDVERLLDRQNDSFRRWVIDNTADERTRTFWRDTYPSYPKDAHLSLVNRLGRFLRSRFVRNLLCQPGAGFNMRQAMDTRKIVLIPLSDGLLGPAADVLAQIFSSAFQLAAMSRANIPPLERIPFSEFVDEFQRVASVSTSTFEQVFPRARKYGLGLVVGFQHLGQLDEGLARDLLGNVGTLIVFRCGASDARRLSRELVGEVDGRLVSVEPGELVSLPVGRAICKIGRTLLRLQTLPPPDDGDPEVRAEVLRRSRERYGVTPKSEALQLPERWAITRSDPEEVF